MEHSPGGCDFYRSIAPCCELVRAPEIMIERPVREVLISVPAEPA